jgi:hypothetical protein
MCLFVAEIDPTSSCDHNIVALRRLYFFSMLCVASLAHLVTLFKIGVIHLETTVKPSYDVLKKSQQIRFIKQESILQV